MKNEDYSQRWISQGKADLQAARSAQSAGRFEWTCFMCQQAAEKFLKGYLLKQGQRVLTTHSIKKLLQEAADHDERFLSHIVLGRDLDQYYFTTRYPDALVDDIPAEHFLAEDAQKALAMAEQIERVVQEAL